MKKFSVVLVGLMISVGVWATASAAVEITGDAYLGVYDKYWCNGFDLSGDQPVVQGGVDIYAGAFTFSWWSNMQLKSDDGAGYQSGEVNENDFTIDYGFDLGELVSLNVGNAYYQLDEWDDTNELYLKVGLNTPLSPTLIAYYDWDEAEEDGLFYTLAIGHNITLAQPLTLSLGALISPVTTRTAITMSSVPRSTTQ